MSEATVDTGGDAPRGPTDRIGGQLVAQTLQSLGTEVAFGVPGVHALAIWEGLRSTEIRAVGTRTELCAGFAADGYARSSGRPGVVLLSTGPGALNSLTAVMEAASSHVPLVLISSQIPSDLLGRGRGYLHELPDQLGAFATLVKGAWRATSIESVPGLLQRAFERALTPPSGPVFVEIPVDLLDRGRRPGVADRRRRARGPAADRAAVAPAGRRGAADGGAVAGDLGGRRRDPGQRAPRGPGAGRTARRAGRDDLHGQGRDRRLASAGRRLRLRRGGVRRADDRSRCRVVRGYRARGRDDQPVRAVVRRGGDPSRRRARADRGDLRVAGARRRRAGDARRARRGGRAAARHPSRRTARRRGDARRGGPHPDRRRAGGPGTFARARTAVDARARAWRGRDRLL